MKFYARDKQLAQIRQLLSLCNERAQMCIISGRQGTGKTTLALKATTDTPTLYFHVSRKAESLLCKEYLYEVNRVLGLNIQTEIHDFRSLFKLLIIESEKRNFNVIIDEIQEFSFLDCNIFKDIASIWERNILHCKMGLILIGNNLKVMNKLCKGRHATYANICDLFLPLNVLSINELKTLCYKYNPEANEDSFLPLYAYTGGVPEYVAPLIDANAFTPQRIIEIFCSPQSSFIEKLANNIIQQVGKEYTIYFSILHCIASDINSRTEIEAIINKEIGGYLTRIENEYGLIKKTTPLLAKNTSKNVRYFMQDNLFQFFFRYIYGHSGLLARNDYASLQKIILDDYTNYSQSILRRYFLQLYEEKENYNIVGSWWSNTDYENNTTSIDLVALNATEDCGIIAHIINGKEDNINTEQLIICSEALKEEISYYKTIDYRLLSTDDI